MRIQIPPSVPTATPAVHPLWNVSTKEGKKDPVEMHGEKITSGVSEIVSPPSSRWRRTVSTCSR